MKAFKVWPIFCPKAASDIFISIWCLLVQMSCQIGRQYLWEILSMYFYREILSTYINSKRAKRAKFEVLCLQTILIMIAKSCMISIPSEYERWILIIPITCIQLNHSQPNHLEADPQLLVQVQCSYQSCNCDRIFVQHCSYSNSIQPSYIPLAVRIQYTCRFIFLKWQ